MSLRPTDEAVCYLRELELPMGQAIRIREIAEEIAQEEGRPQIDKEDVRRAYTMALGAADV